MCIRDSRRSVARRAPRPAAAAPRQTDAPGETTTVARPPAAGLQSRWHRNRPTPRAHSSCRKPAPKPDCARFPRQSPPHPGP
eukprot:13085555-Alexandrium_andersonii.AAC.1